MNLNNTISISVILFGLAGLGDWDRHSRFWVRFYEDRYGLHDVYEKAVDNDGNGFEALYGVRNFRAVLFGAMYRGGANNSNHRSRPRLNMNPLPEEGLENLCREGFGLVVYLYSKNFEKARTEMSCQSLRSSDHRLSYIRKNPFEEKDLRELLGHIFSTISSYRHGPIYTHCWNGWHASGYLAAIALRQFCAVGPEEAIRYWDRATDGKNKKRSYAGIRRRIREFSPHAELQVPSEIQAEICPPIS